MEPRNLRRAGTHLTGSGIGMLKELREKRSRQKKNESERAYWDDSPSKSELTVHDDGCGCVAVWREDNCERGNVRKKEIE